jgi:hypothetical protein
MHRALPFVENQKARGAAAMAQRGQCAGYQSTPRKEKHCKGSKGVCHVLNDIRGWLDGLRAAWKTQQTGVQSQRSGRQPVSARGRR